MLQKQQATQNILIVEDDAAIGSILLHIAMDEVNYLSILVTDSLAALAVIKDIQPVLFILNYQLPHMDGLELYDRLHSIPGLEKVPAIMVSANLPLQELARRNIVGIEKPFDIDNLLRNIEDLLLSSPCKNSSLEN